MICVKDLVKKFGDLTAVDHRVVRRAARGNFRLPRAQRRGKDHNHQNAHHSDDAHQRQSGDRWAQPRNSFRRGAEAVRHRILGSEPGWRHDRLREHGIARGLLSRTAQATRREDRASTPIFELWDRRKDQVKLFSGGMKRRLEIARGLLHSPRILFLDEPTLGLDVQTRNQLWTHVKHLNQTEGVTVFLTTHYMDEAERVAQRIAVIDHGKIVADGTPDELKQKTGKTSLEEAFLALTGVGDSRRGGLIEGSVTADGADVGESAMSVIYVLWLRGIAALRTVASADCGLARTAAPLSSRAGFRSRPDIPEGRPRQLSAVRRTGNYRNDDSVQFHLLRRRPDLRPAVRISERDAGGARAPYLHHAGADAWRGDGGRPAESAGRRGLRALWIPPGGLPYPSPALLFMALIASLFSSLGTAIGSSLQNIQGFQMIMSFLVMPIFFLSGALYPLNNLPRR